MTTSPFVHLRVRTEYSIVDSLVRIPSLIQKISADGMQAVGISDFCNFFAAVKLYQAAIDKGIKPLLGVDFPCCPRDTPEDVNILSVLCMNLSGYRQATRLISRAYQEGQVKGEPRVYEEWLTAEDTSGLLVLSGGRGGRVGKALIEGNLARATEAAAQLAALFPGRFYLEIQRLGWINEEAQNALLVGLADALQLPLVATNEVRFMQVNEFDAHEARVCIHDGQTLTDNVSQRYKNTQYLRSSEEMVRLFSDLPQALENTVEISRRCTVPLQMGHAVLPRFQAPEGLSEEVYLTQLAENGLEARFAEMVDEVSAEKRSIYESRLKAELDVIQSMGFSGYFLIVADFIRWSKSQGIRVGPGRGSGAGSLVAYTLSITDLDPLMYDLLFERFLNPERVSMPDFDVDFCMEGRDRVIDYVMDKYGRANVSQIITFGSMAAKAVLRDVGRVMGHPYGFVDTLAKLIPFDLGMTLERALEESPVLKQRYEDEEEVQELMKLALHLEGLVRNPGKHAGGVVIAPSALTDFTALYCEADSPQIVSQFDKDDIETVGLVKFDFLGLRTLTIIEWALIAINQQRATKQLPPIVIEHIPLNCEKTFALLKACQTGAVFQLESRGMKELVSRLQPDSFEEIIALVALFRPGPLQSGMVEDFINRKHGRASVDYPHPDIETILKPTYGVILYQEQVMQIAQVLANYTLGAADLLRRAMGKKKPEEMAKQRVIFTEGAAQRGIASEVSGPIFDLMEKFAGYGFNKSHSATYAMLTYQTAWLKTHYPSYFMAAVLSADMDHTDKVVLMIEECRRMQVVILPPSVESSFVSFTVEGDGAIRYGLGAIKGVGAAAIEAMLVAREQGGAFGGLFEFCRRVEFRKMNRRVLEALIKSGAMDEWEVERSVLFANLTTAMQFSDAKHQEAHDGQLDLFSDMGARVVPRYQEALPWPLREQLTYEKELLGWYLSAHPTSVYYEEWKSWVQLIETLDPTRSKRARVCVLIKSLRTVLTKSNKTLWIIGIEDASTTMEVVMFGENATRYEALLVVGEVLLLEGELSRDAFNGGVKMMVSSCCTPLEMRTKHAKKLVIQWQQQSAPQMQQLQQILQSSPGGHGVELAYQSATARARLQLGEAWRVALSDPLLSDLRRAFGSEAVVVEYDQG